MKLPAYYDDLEPSQRRAVRKEYIRIQEGKCHYCKANLNGEPSAEVMVKAIKWRLFPETFQDWPIHLHHSHETGLTIGAVHMRCNAVLWQYEGE